MKWVLAGLLAVSVFEMRPAPADACGIKLVIKTSTPRKAVARSANPSHLLLLGTPPHRLERELAQAGHDVEVEPTPADAKRTTYQVVVVDSRQADEARAKFPGAVVIVRSGDVSSDIASVETNVSRRPVAVAEARTVVRATEARRPVAAGPTPSNKIVGAKAPGDSTGPEVAAKEPTKEPVTETPPPAKEPAKQPVAVKEPVKEPVSETPAPKEPAVVETTHPTATESKPAPAAKAATMHDELYFSYASSKLGKTGSLDRDVKWLNDHSSVNIVVEGYADPTGSHEANMALGQSRAESVRDYLVGKGIDTGRIEVVSYGDTRLKYGKADGRNRRAYIQPKQ
jgi:peptidoglycan-associated lipoprotein